MPFPAFGSSTLSHLCGCWLKYGQSGTAMTIASTTPAPNVSIIARNDPARYPTKNATTPKMPMVTWYMSSESRWPL